MLRSTLLALAISIGAASSAEAQDCCHGPEAAIGVAIGVAGLAANATFVVADIAYADRWLQPEWSITQLVFGVLELAGAVPFFYFGARSPDPEIYLGVGAAMTAFGAFFVAHAIVSLVLHRPEPALPRVSLAPTAGGAHLAISGSF
ncbi:MULTISPECIES: hypothetical protein [Sandaracinus]|uniref:hypothetical protein n=1 Tax=Sandaracinus TaxID=1055688 RepID=UPI0019D4DFAF|nr:MULTISPECIES: hypothetical protein [Sandaracinus]QRN75832.1 Hypothetical protein MSR10575_89190 [Sandaracinus sp.]UJR87370.1 Hypothetical protein I5071_1620 [Sandaracinus amylolyticus]